MEIGNSKRVKSPSPTAGWSPEPVAIAAIAQAPLNSHGKPGNLPLAPAAPESTLCILADFQTAVASLCQWVLEVFLATADRWSIAGVLHGPGTAWSLPHRRHCHGLGHVGWERDRQAVGPAGWRWLEAWWHPLLRLQEATLDQGLCTHSCVQRHESPGSRGLGHPLCLLCPDY